MLRPTTDKKQVPGNRLCPLDTPAAISNSALVENKVLEWETSFAIAVAGFAQMVGSGQYTGDWTYQDVIDVADKKQG